MSREKRRNIGMFFFALSLAFIGIGASRGEVATVLTKAILLCLECVGIG